MTKKLALVAACCRSHGIGIDGNLPWRLKKELEFFSRITSSLSPDFNASGDSEVKKNAVIMGIRTYMCIPPAYRPLKGRVNVVLSRTASATPAGVDYLFRSFQEAVDTLSSLPEIDQLHVIGGEAVYKEAITRADCELIFLTRIDSDFECDRFFPKIDESVYEDLTDITRTPEQEKIWKLYDIPEGVQTENGLSYRYHLYRRRSEAQ